MELALFDARSVGLFDVAFTAPRGGVEFVKEATVSETTPEPIREPEA